VQPIVRTISQLAEMRSAAPDTASRRYDVLRRISRAVSECRTPEEPLRIARELHILIYRNNSADVQWHALGPADIPYPHLPVLAFDDAPNFETSHGAQAELQLQKHRLKLLLEMTNRFVSTLDLRDLLRSICASVRPVIGCDSATLMLPDAKDKRLRVHVHDFPGGKGIILERKLPRFASACS